MTDGRDDTINSLYDIAQKKYDFRENQKYETLFTLANGYRGLRGALEFSKIGNRGNFIAGIFDKNTAQVTEIVNCQDPLTLNIYTEDELVDLDICKVLSFRRNLNMKDGILEGTFEVKTLSGKIIKINTERFVSKNNVHRWASKYTIVPVNFSGKVFIENIIDGTVANSSLDPVNVSKHFCVVKACDLKPGIALKSTTIDKKIEIVEGTCILSTGTDGNLLKERKFSQFDGKVRELYQIFVEEGKEYSIYKYGATYTSRDGGNCISSLRNELDSFLYDGYDTEKQAHMKEWNDTWNDIDIIISGDDKAQIGLRFNLFHLASSAYKGDDKVSIAAKALHGEGYKGHVFWDTETFMLPFFIYTEPKIARTLLAYRYNTLDGARKNASLNGFKGAQFPWESADEGIEVTPKWGKDYYGNPVRIWTGDEEYHINSDITFAIWEYYRATGDKEFMIKYGLEIFLDTSKFWQSRVEYNAGKDRYDINRVIGPDEFHEHVDNNAYTNYLVKWSLKKSLQLIQWIKNENMVIFNKLCTKLSLSNSDFKAWDDIQRKIYIPKSEDGMLIEQFEGYFKLKQYKVTEHDENGMPVWPEGVKLDKLGETQLVKQPDVVMLMLMLGEEFDMETKKQNYDYYEKRTMHKSSLSPSIYSILGLSVGDTHNAYKYFIKTIMTDLDDYHGNSASGLHAANAGGAWQSAVFGFGGLSIDREQKINLNPWLPEKWEKLSFKVKWKNTILTITVNKTEVELHSNKNIELKVYDSNYSIEADRSIRVKR
ncbi:MAG TPA: kojibiose phosphorylase [Clostridiaceae bacterium]|nr:kojibiose phosphorylase [Clostridiaceae bacterium]